MSNMGLFNLSMANILEDNLSDMRLVRTSVKISIDNWLAVSFVEKFER